MCVFLCVVTADHGFRHDESGPVQMKYIRLISVCVAEMIPIPI